MELLLNMKTIMYVKIEQGIDVTTCYYCIAGNFHENARDRGFRE